LRDGIRKMEEGLALDEVVRTMQNDQTSNNYVFQRMKEVIDNALVADYEQQLGNLKQENVLIKEKIYCLEKEKEEKKGVEVETL